MNTYHKIVSTDDLQLVFEEFGNDVVSLINTARLFESYRDWQWFVRRCDEYPLILNAIPPGTDFSLHFWEEWYLLDNTVHHHVLYLTAPDDYDEIFIAPDDDDIHPPETLAKKWFVLDDLDLSPVNLRQANEFSSLWMAAPRQPVYRRETIPTPEADEVLVEIKACGICGTDLHFYNEWPENTLSPLGHELSGKVVETGSVVRNVAPGDRVVIQNHIACGSCRNCLNQKPSKCLSIRTYMNDQAGLGEYLCIPSAMCISFTGLDYPEATLAEPLTVSLDLIERSRISAGDSVLVVGPGIIGLGCIPLAIAEGASRVVVVGRAKGNERGRYRLDVATELGASATIDSYLPEWKDALSKDSPEGYDKIIITAPPRTIPDFLDFLSFGGDLIYDGISFSDDEICISANKVHFNKNSIVSSHAIPNWGFPRALELIQSGKIRTDQLLSHRFPFRQAERAISVNLDNTVPCIKSVVEF